MWTIWVVLPMVVVAELTCPTTLQQRYGQELVERERWGQNIFTMTMIDIGKRLPAGILERFVALMHKDQNVAVRMRFQIWFPVDKNRATYRLDYEQIVDIQPSTGEYTRRSFEANGCFSVLEGSYIGWTLEQNKLPIVYNLDQNYPMLYRLIGQNARFPLVGTSYTFDIGSSIGMTPAVFSIAADIGQLTSGIPGSETNAIGATGIPGRIGQPGPEGPPGFTGAAGERGETGLPGRQGQQGYPGQPGQSVESQDGSTGHTGEPGLKGETGFTGAAGPNGVTGYTGSTGLSGRTGQAGRPGSRGSDGSPGRDGQSGATGYPGRNGSPGRDGISGSPGSRGSPGPQGSTGQRGSAGSPGANGLQGATGYPGASGINGAPGSRGPLGQDGTAGVPGYPGQKGATGLPGEDGQPGQVGPSGLQGARGLTGRVGRTGEPGKQGFDGTPGATGLPGRNGAAGATGQPGIPGEKGETGFRGNNGARGLPGQQGYTGLAGTPGVPGSDGRPGTNGATGEPGPRGPTGFRGPPGLGGATGRIGIAGRSGIPGRDGKPGPAGQKGATGSPGRPGRAGLSGRRGGTGELGRVGDSGATGRPGAVGVPGPNGPRGFKGSTGERGRTGVAGRPGQRGRQGATGLSGIAGGPGLVGERGPAGSSGRPGFNGATGATGSIGSPGLSGKQGLSGRIGATGLPGSSGREGSPGRRGSSGLQGATGQSGAPGGVGYPGFAGSPGATGVPGVPGIHGATGFTGRTGYRAIPGATGATGEQGTAGRPGGQGQTGSAGPVGPRGYTGAQGRQGLPGSNGRDGESGSRGPTGVVGATGATGIPGARGTDGRPGRSGSTGASGAPGIIGVQGRTGSPGFEGEPGARGLDGIPGSTGSTGTSGSAGSRGLTGQSGRHGFTGHTGPFGQRGRPGPTGITGATGATGSRGFNGQPGRSGFRGKPGATGASGFTGFPGRPGQRGPGGFTGFSGATGTSGRDGSRGEPGSVGQQGVTGLRGEPGRRGSRGSGGIPGSIGATGERGLDGRPGKPGFTGERGPRGFDGSQGSSGRDGPQGYTGAPGEQGERGVQGAGGLPGPNGFDGKSGATGAPGPNGSHGPSGQTGEPGIPGSEGRRGLTGISGPVGPSGERGPVGVIGRPGTIGEPGVQGATGEAGLPGQRGEDGPQGWTGLSGSTGPAGEAGQRGFPGFIGEPGNPGLLGSQGATGNPGEPGSPGSSGERGIDGEQGFTGSPGFPGSPGRTDNNECSINNGGCAHFCINLFETYMCQCRVGYQLHSDQRNCTDIDECSKYGPCHQKCVNTIGSFRCECLQGFVPFDSGNGIICRDKDECIERNPCDISEICVNTYGTYVCLKKTEIGIELERMRCDFERSSSCLWRTNNLEYFGVQLQNGFYWKVDSGSVDGSRPDRDHTTGQGYYIYMDATERGTTSDLISSLIINSNEGCMTFWYHMHGRDIGTLTLKQLYSEGRDAMVTLWQSSGDQGNIWKMARVAIPRVPSGEHYVLVFEGQSGGESSKMAIDDIFVSQGTCTRPVETPEDLTCDFRNQQICRWDQVDRDWNEFGVQLTDDFDWIIQSGSTVGRNTGPDVDHTTGSGNYIYLPTSSLDAGTTLFGQTAWFTTHLVLNRNEACIQFYYHMYGPSMGTLSVHQLYNAGLSSMATLWERSGDQGNAWNKAELTIPRVPSGDYYILLFKGVAAGLSSDMAIDDILVTTGSCQVTPDPVNPEMIACNFGDVECRWSQITGNWNQFGVQLKDDIDWIKSRGSLISETGPKFDHTSGTGNYLYVPASTTRFIGSIAGKSAWYATHRIFNRQISCMTFWYHMHGREMGTLRLHQLYDAGLGAMVKLWELTGDQGNEWKQAQVTLPLAASGDYYILLFEGVIGGILSDMAIDDVDVKAGECAQSDELCTFDADACTWTQVGDLTLAFGEKLQDELDWTVNSGFTNSEETGPNRDHTSGSGSYMYLETSSPAKQGDRAWFMSDVIIAKSACLSFYYHMYGANIGELKIYQLHSASQGNVIQLWDKKGDQGDQWREVHVTLPYVPGDTYRVLIEGVVGNGFKGDVAIDDIRYTPEKCTDTGPDGVDETCTFEPDVEPPCSWSQVTESTKAFNNPLRDDMDWTRRSQGTPSGGTGPDVDHTPGKGGQGQFMYIESSSPARIGNKAWIISRELNYPRVCLHFWYHMQGSHIGYLNVYQLDKKGVSQMKSLWQKSEAQGNAWFLAEVQVPNSNNPYVLVIEAVVGSGYQGDIAIDDIRVWDGDCQRAVAQYGEEASLRKPEDTDNNGSGVLIEIPAACALFGSMAVLTIVIFGLLVYKRRTLKFNSVTESPSYSHHST